MSEVIFSDAAICSYVDFKQKTDKHKFIFSYRGKLSHAIVKNLLAMAEKKIDSFNEEASVKKKIFGVMVNCLQTICADDKLEETGSSSIFLISKNADGFTIFTGRYLDKNIVDKLQEIIESINQLSRESLSDLYKEKLKELEKLNEKFNVDETILSLIDIAKKTNQKIVYLVEPSSENDFFFSIKVQIK